MGAHYYSILSGGLFKLFADAWKHVDLAYLGHRLEWRRKRPKLFPVDVLRFLERQQFDTKPLGSLDHWFEEAVVRHDHNLVDLHSTFAEILADQRLELRRIHLTAMISRLHGDFYSIGTDC